MGSGLEGRHRTPCPLPRSPVLPWEVRGAQAAQCSTEIETDLTAVLEQRRKLLTRQRRKGRSSSRWVLEPAASNLKNKP